MKRRLMTTVATGALVGAMVVGGAASALAGERGGNGERTAAPDHARSECAFSGLEDFDFEAPVQPGVVQNWGQIAKTGAHFGGPALLGCNPQRHSAS